MAADLSTKQQALSTTAAKIADGKTYNSTVYVKNNDASIAVFVGKAGVTSSTGYKLAAGAELKLEMAKGSADLYAVAASGTPSVSVMRVVQ